MKKRIFLYVFALILFGNMPLFAVDQLEAAYKEQFDKYAAEDKSIQADLVSEHASLDKFQALYDRTQFRDIRRQISNDLIYFAKRIETLKIRSKELSDKKLELKMRVLEKLGALPDWWQE